MMKTSDFIGRFFLNDLSVCDRLIEYYNQSPNKFTGRIGSGVFKEAKDSTDVPVAVNSFWTVPVITDYLNELQKVCDQYIEMYPWCNRASPWGIMQPFNIQHYAPGQGYHAMHCERYSTKDLVRNRHLVFMTYLNDVTDEGYTEFYHQDVKVQPRKGLTLIWPADWTHVHRGIVSKSEDKYIATGWYEYYEAEKRT